MHTDKKLTKEDTWRPADLRRYIKEEERGGGHVRRRDDYDRKHRGGESTERRNRDPEKDSRREKERIREGESTRERRDEEKKDRKIEGSQDRRADRESYRRDEREREKKREKERLVDGSKYGNDYRENKDRRRDREEKHDRERNKERHREKEKERARDSDRYKEEDRNKTREYGDKERKREEQAREHRPDRDRRRHEENWEGRSNRIEKHHREEKDRHRAKEGRKNEFEDKRNDKEERRGDRKHSEQKEDREYKEEQRKHKEERERRHTERGHRDEKQKHDSEFRVHRGDEIRHHRADRERADRDKHKDRRYKEEEDPERKHRERRHKDEGDVERKHKERRHRGEEDQKDKRSSSDKSQVPERNVVQTEQVDMVSEHWIAAVKHEGDTEEPVVNDEDLANQEYEDDFEDYEEDFEELNESTNEDEDEKEPLHLASPVQAGEAKEELSAQERKEMEAIQRAMDEENERVGTAQSRQSTRREEERPKWSKDTETIQSRASQRGRFIDFVAAKQREVSKKVADKQKKRSTELLRLIDLDFSMTFSLLDLPPVNEYDMYIRNFGKANTKQAYVQCNEDNADRDIQTEEIEMSEKWTQHPPEHSGACGDPNFSQESQDQYRSEMNFDSQRLASFLCSASQVMIVLLEEDQTSRKSLQKLSTQSDIKSFSDGSLQLNTKLPFLYGRQISMLHFSQVQKYTMMSVHMPRTEPSVMALDSCTIICIWNIWEPSRPQRILVYESEIQCCCFSPGKATMVFAGTSVGSVVLWDLREQASNHNRLKMGEEEWTFRQPTFSTDSVMAASSHFSSVTSVEVVPSALTGELRPDIPLLASEEESSGLSFQLASLDESGVLNFWVVVELPKADEAGSPTDLGLRPGGKVKLLHSSSHPAAERGSPRGVVKMGPLQTLLLKFLPTDSNHFFIGTNMGLVHHGTSHGLKAPPKFYQFQEVEVQPVDVTSIHFSLFRPHLFLVGCGNGSIRLHAVSHDQPVAQWKNSTAGEPVVSLQWAQTRPTVFCVLDAASNLHIWDLLKNDTQPVVTEDMNSDRVTAMAVFGDVGKQNTYSGVALAHESGKIEMQYFKRSLTVSCSAEEEKLLERMMTEAF